jgi:hypothetical protein
MVKLPLQQSTFATIGIQGQDNELGKTSLKQLEEFTNAVGVKVKSIATIGLQNNVEVRLHEKQHKVAAAMISDNFAQMLEAQISNENTIHVGILELSMGMTTNDIVKTPTTSSPSDESSSIYAANTFAAVSIIPGIELAPQARQQLKFQWWLIFCLSVALGLVNGLNLLTGSATQLINRQQEMNVRIAVGATLPNLVKTLLTEQLPLLLLSTISAGLMIFYSLMLLNNYQFPLAKMPPASLLSSWLITVALLVLLIVLVIAVAVIQIHKMQIFSKR